MNMDVMFINCLGMKCPMPIVHVSRVAQSASKGSQIEASADDPAFYSDIHAWCEITGHKVEPLPTDDASIIRVLITLQN
jgi:tRNA 2-thiouridine synthesizing protein A